MKSARLSVVLGMLVLFVFVRAFASGVPRLITYQGKLTNSSGVALDGSYDITFRLYTTETGGTPIWTEAHTDDDAITVTNGLFDVQLGTIADLNIAFDDTYWIELQVGTETLSPRERLVAVPYAFRAIVADTAMIVGSGAVQTDGTINGDGTAGSPLGTVIGNSIESSEITDGTIVDDDISASAAIDWSKLAVGTANRILMTNGSGVLSEVAAPTEDYYLKWDGSAYTWSAISTDMENHTAGNGLSGSAYNGSSPITWTVDPGNGISVDATGVNVIYGNSANTAVEGNRQITITAGTGLSGGGTITLGSGGSVTLNNNDRGSSQNIFKQIQNSSGTTEFSAGSNNDYLQFAGTGGASVSFDAANHRVTIDASGAGDGNNYTTGISFSGTSTKTLTLSRNGLSDLTASFTDDNTTYSAGNGISLSGTVFSVAGNDGLTQDADGLSVGAGNGITVSADNISVQAADGTIEVTSSGVRQGNGATKATSTSYKLYRNY